MKHMGLWKVVAAGFVLSAGTLFGGTEYLWSLGNNGNWGVNANWSPNTGFPVAGDTAVFSNATGRTVTIDANPRSADSVIVRAGAWTLQGTSPNNLNVGTLFDYANTSSGNAANSTMSAILSGNGGLRVSSGQLIVSGANTFLGATTLTGGKLQLGHDAALGNTAQTLSLGSGTIASYSANRTVGNPVTLDGDTLFGSGIDTQTRTLSFTNATTLTDNRTIKVYGAPSSGVGSWSRTTTFSKGISDGANSFILTTSSDNPSTDTGYGHGLFCLTGSSSFGQLIVNGCVVQLSAANSFDNETRLQAGADTNRPGVLMIGHNDALGSPALRILGGSIHTISADQTVPNNVYLDADISSATPNQSASADKYLTFGGTTTLSASRIFNTADRRHLGFSGAIGDGGNNYSITKQGLGNLLLGGANTFGGGVRVEAGRLLVNHNNALGSGVLTITNTVGVQHTAGGGVTITVPNDFQLDGNIDNISLSTAANGTTLKTTGTTTLSGDRTISIYSDGYGSRGAIELAGTVTDGAASYGLTKLGTGTLTLSGNNTFDGGVTVYAGLLNLPVANPSLNGGIRLIPGRSMAYIGANNPISPTIFVYNDQSLGTGAFAWEGTPVYRPAPFPYGIQACLDQKASSSPGYVALANEVTMSGYVGTSANSTKARTVRLTCATPVLGGDTILGTYKDGNGDCFLEFTGGLTDGANSYQVIKVGGGQGGLLGLLGNNSFDGPLTVYQGVVYLTGDNTAMTGAKNVYAGTLQGQARTTGSLLGPAAVTLADNAAVLRLDSLNTVTDTALSGIVFDKSAPMVWTRGVASGTTWTAPSLTRQGRGILHFAGGTSSAGALTANDKFKVTGWTDPASGMIAPFFIEQTGDYLTYDAAGVGIKRAAYSASTDINSAGSAAIFSAAAVQTLTASREVYALRAGSTSGIGGAFDLTIGSGGLSATAAQTIGCNLQFGGQEGVIWNSANVSVSGAIKGSGGLTKGGAGTLTLGSANTYTGATTIHNGQITLNAAGALPTGQPLAVNNSILELNGQNATVSDLSMSGGQILNSSATASALTLSTNITFNGGYNIASIWPLATRTLGAAFSGPTVFTVANGYSTPDLRLGDGARVVALSGSSTPIMKKGPGFLQFAGNSTFTGDITVEDGILHGVAGGVAFQPFGSAANKVFLKRNGILSFNGNGVSGQTTSLGDTEFSGANAIRAPTDHTALGVTISNLVRKAGSRGTLAFLGPSGVYSEHWSGYPHLYIGGWKTPNPSPNTNRILPPHFMFAHAGDALGQGHFACADNTTGEVKILSGVGNIANNHHKATLVGALATDVIDLAAAEALAANLEIYALRTSSGITASGDPTLTLGSGGLIANADLTLAPKLKFGPTGAAEALVFVGGYLGYTKTATLSAAISTSGGLTKFGEGTLAMTADSSATLAGDHWVNQGTLRLANAQALASAAAVNIERGAVVDIAGNYTLAHAFKGLGGITTGTNLLTLTGSLTPGFSVGTLTIGNLDFRGTLNWEYDATNSTDVVACDTLTFGNSASKIVNASWLGAGDAPAGDYTLFTYTGADPVVTAGEWTVNAPSGKAGTVLLDAANNQVLLRIGQLASGTVLMLQ